VSWLALYALRDPDDASHGRAREDLENLGAQRTGVVVPYSTLTEGHALVLRKLGLAEARSLLRYLIRTAIFVNPTAEDYDRAAARTLRYTDQDVTLADAGQAEIGVRFGVPVWTYDRHFDVMGARVWRP